MSAQHTSGPWVCYADLPSTEPNWHIITNGSRLRVIANVHIEPGNEVDEANARLIAAAPELLEALRLSLGHVRWAAAYCRNPSVANKVLEMAEAAIAKVEGRS